MKQTLVKLSTCKTGSVKRRRTYESGKYPRNEMKRSVMKVKYKNATDSTADIWTCEEVEENIMQATFAMSVRLL